MGIIASAKGEFLKVALDKLIQGNSGSTALGAIAAAVLASGASFGDLFGSDQTKQMHAAGLIVAAIVVGVWGYFIGKKK